MKLSDFDYELPRELIAQEPCAERDAARLFVHDVGLERSAHARVRDLPRFLASGDLLVLNDTRVLQARLHGRRASGGEVEVFLVEPAADPPGAWMALVHPGRRLKPGEEVLVEGGRVTVHMHARALRADGSLAPEWIVELRDEESGGRDALAILERHGHVPLPPYVERSRSLEREAERVDRERYQTVYARVPGASAAPTAGLHFTEALFSALSDHGVERAFVTLHVGPGTFQPVKSEDPRDHVMHAERFELAAATVEAVARTRARGGRVVAVGTTSLRVLESSLDGRGELVAGRGETSLFLYPGKPIRVVDALLTNFHLPRSTLFMLVSAVAGLERVLALYREAIERRYRFYSYGDAMLLLR